MIKRNKGNIKGKNAEIDQVIRASERLLKLLKQVIKGNNGIYKTRERGPPTPGHRTGRSRSWGGLGTRSIFRTLTHFVL